MRFSEEDLARLKAFAEGGIFGTNWHWTLREGAPEPGVCSGAAGFEPATSRV
jgi:hypothetical protein